jgi:hypothetical protein
VEVISQGKRNAMFEWFHGKLLAHKKYEGSISLEAETIRINSSKGLKKRRFAMKVGRIMGR